MRSVVLAWTTRANVNEEAGGRERVRPEPRRHVGVEEQHADTVIQRAKDALDATILLRRAGASETKDNAMGRKEIADGDVVKLYSVVSLQDKNRTIELCGDI